MPLKVAFYLGLFLFTPQSCLALTIVPENMGISFPGTYLSGRGQNAVSSPAHNQLYVVRFYVEGEPGKKLPSPYLITNILIMTRHLEKLRYVEFFTGAVYLNAGAQK